MWHQIKSWSYLRVIIFSSATEACKMIFLKCIFTTYHHIKIKEITEITEIELLNENEKNRQSVISYRHLKKLKIYLAKKFQVIAIYLFSTFCSRNKYIDTKFICRHCNYNKI